MKLTRMLAAAVAAIAFVAGPALAQADLRPYVIDCGHGVAGDVSRWSGENPGQSMAFVTNCYLIRHGDAWMMWDTGVSDAVAAKPQGQAPADPRAVHWYRSTTLARSLETLGVKPADIRFVAVSHTHGDHMGNVELLPQATLLVQRAEYDWPDPKGGPRFEPAHPVQKLDGDHDVFGDGTVTILATPGHTPGHQSLRVRLRNTGTVVLSGDLAHFSGNWEHRRVPSFNFDKEKSAASMQRVADILAQEKGQIWINHDQAQRDALRLAPAYYD